MAAPPPPSSSPSSSSPSSQLVELQEVVRYLRRSREAAEVELTLLKQERLRLCKQVGGCMQGAEQAGGWVHAGG